jgi:hypothetical protein
MLISDEILSSLNWPLSRFNVTMHLVLKRYEIFRFFVFQIAECEIRLWTIQRSRSSCDLTVQILLGYHELGLREP